MSMLLTGKGHPTTGLSRHREQAGAQLQPLATSALQGVGHVADGSKKYSLAR